MNLRTLEILQVAAENAPIPLLLEADPSEQNVKAYLNKSHCFIAKLAGTVVGVYVLQPIE